MSKTYLEKLIPDEVIRRLKAGEVLIDERNNGKIKYINGVFLDFIRGMLFWVIGFFEFAGEFTILAVIAEHYNKRGVTHVD